MIERLAMLAWPGSANRLTILMYHRVLAQPDPMREGVVQARTFARQMRFLAQHCSVMPLMAAVEALKRERLPRRACCITFDDGYADNFTVAGPILARYRLPATVFVAAGYLDGGRMFNDTVIEWAARVHGPALDLRWLGLGRHPVDTPAQRCELVRLILDVVRFMPPRQREERVQQLLQSVPVAPLPDDLMLSTAQLRQLSAQGIEIGGHTLEHIVLTTVDLDAARAEILEGRRRLEAITGKPVRSFAYPNGRPQADYTADHVALVKALQFEAAVTTAHGVANEHSDRFQLPRFTPWGGSTALLAARMARNARLGRPAGLCAAEPVPSWGSGARYG